MDIIVNGTSRTVPENATLQTLLCTFDLAFERVAIEHNGQIVPRQQYEVVQLKPNDRLEIVRFVGGG